MMKYTRAISVFSIPLAIIIIATVIYLQNKAPEEIRTIFSTSQISITKGAMKISSTVFENNGIIPAIYTCDGDDINPPLSIGEVPAEAKSLALVVHDPDAPAGDWTHWIVWNIPVETTEIIEGAPPAGIEGTTDFKQTGWGGPCPPSGSHRYFFTLYALDTELSLTASAKRSDLTKAIEGHILDEAELIGKYQRK